MLNTSHKRRLKICEPTAMIGGCKNWLNLHKNGSSLYCRSQRTVTKWWTHLKDSDVTGVKKFKKKSRCYLNIPITRRATLSKFHTGDPQILGSIIQDLVIRAKWSPLFIVAPCILETPTLLHTNKCTVIL